MVQSSKDLRFKYDSDEKRTENRPHDIPLEDFKILLKYWADEGVQSLAVENAARRNSYADPHTLGSKTLVEVKEKLKKQDPNLASPSRARVYFKSRKHKEGRKYKTNRDAIKKIINYAMREKVNYLNSELFDSSYRETIDEVLREGGDADAVLPGGKHGPDWLVGRQGSLLALENTPAIPQPSADELTAKITRDLESQMEAKVNRKVQENVTWFLKKSGEANPTLKFDIGDFCATFSSDQDESGTPITQTPGGATS
ncbi:hypothetical protein OROHE_002848 [Orobanche hederae]